MVEKCFPFQKETRKTNDIMSQIWPPLAFNVHSDYHGYNSNVILFVFLNVWTVQVVQLFALFVDSFRTSEYFCLTPVER